MHSQKISFMQPAIDFDRELIVRYDGKGPRYTSYPTADRFVTGLSQASHVESLMRRTPGALAMPLSLYFHLPFCNTVCYYCGCNKIITKDQTKADQYLDYLTQEVQMYGVLMPNRPAVSQLHLGGGTPTFLSHDQLQRLMDVVNAHFTLQKNGEYSIEIDPRKVGEDTIKHLAGLGFNRMSVGIQDFNPEVQIAVNRVQSEAETRTVIEAARMYGFRSVSVDLIYGLPKQSAASIAETIERVLLLKPDRIALYNYAHLPERFMPQRRINADELPSAEVKLDILQNSIEQLTQAGYVLIGMDHFALPNDDLAVAQRRGRLQRNFQGYSTHADCDLLAFGVSSIGKVGASYFQNVKTLDEYYAKLDQQLFPVERGLTMNRDDVIRRAAIQALMCQFQLFYQPFEAGYMIDFAEYFAEELRLLQPLVVDGLVELESDGIFVTPKGRMLIRSIAMVFDAYLRTKATKARYSQLI
ncbi:MULTISPECIES: oxygen-independent coproporphyrinogen III oxidase [Deefgea]|uniref:Coproporphyrinogen-III oxidase n=1 Tax=Deefgea chitinilytica TaxID=570276 RepID=A0ABS2C8D3_9NEIS|nr:MULTISPECIES: oxygen-independent coproporphyrinogen III oxidase [Deefgea]MBM5570418.1 oxygen-independent coproporphyrinogen III oxidase [Deefgea chitinilytica]MBM9887647.1 oxygen-independent coproporphyrinogen III oxidase [Deefgea sp. CFH1-16]